MKGNGRKERIRCIFKKYRDTKLSKMKGEDPLEDMGVLFAFDETEANQMDLARLLTKGGDHTLEALDNEARKGSFKLMDTLLGLPPGALVETIRKGI